MQTTPRAHRHHHGDGGSSSSTSNKVSVDPRCFDIQVPPCKEHGRRQQFQLATNHRTHRLENELELLTSDFEMRMFLPFSGYLEGYTIHTYFLPIHLLEEGARRKGSCVRKPFCRHHRLLSFNWHSYPVHFLIL